MYKILIAEDESEMRNLLVKYIKRTQPDLEVVGSAVNGREALTLLEQYRPDIALTDISMPVMDGLEFLQEAAKRNIPVKAVIVSGYDEFAYAKKAIALGVSEYLLKPFDPQELEEALEKIKEELGKQKVFLDNIQLLREKAGANETFLREQILRDILEGKVQERQEKDIALDILDTAASYYCVCLLKFPLYLMAGVFGGNENRGGNKCGSKKGNIEEMALILSAGCIHQDIRVQGLSFEENGVILIMSGNAPGKHQFFLKVKAGVIHLQQSMEKYYDIRLICVIGGIYGGWRMLPVSYEETLKVWRRLTSTDKNLIVCGEEKAETDTDKLPASSKEIQKLKEKILLLVRMGREKESMEYLDELINVYASISPKKIDFVSISAEELVYAIFNEIEMSGIRLDEQQSNEEIQRRMKEQLKHASLLEIRELLKNYFSMCHKPFSEYNSRQQSEAIVENVKNLIECNLEREELNLEWLAGRIHFSTTYVRQIFKQKTGESLMEYIIRKRMEKAAELLLKSNMKVQEIAEACGYSNQRYFASSFRKYYDCTPTEFKQQFGELR